MNNYNELLDKIHNARSLDFGDIISETIELFKKVWIKGLIIVLMIMFSAICISLVFSLIGVAPALNTDVFNEGFDFKEFASYYSSTALYGIPQNMLMSTINLAFIAAFYRICNQVVSGKDGQDDYFYFFNKAYFTKVFMLGIVYAAIATIAQLMCFIPYLYAFVPLSYFAVILANNPDLSEAEIIKASFALGNKKWLISFGTIIIAFFIGMLGILGCIIGIIFTMSIFYLPSFLIYKNSIDFNNENTIEVIETSAD